MGIDVDHIAVVMYLKKYNTAAAIAGKVTAAQRLALKRIWFGHQSVGNYLMHGPSDDNAVGMVKLFEDHPEYGLSNVDSPTSIGAISVGTLADGHIGSNGHPDSKLTAFNTAVRTTFGGALDIAIIKFCWIDFYDSYADIQNTATADSFWTTYKSTIDALIADYPGAVIVPCTVPVTPNDADGGNTLREYFSQKIRDEYGSVVFDVSDWESRNTSGTLELYNGTRELNAAWDVGDGGHPNATGSTMLAEKLYAHLLTLV